MNDAYEQRQLMELEIKRTTAEAELTKQRALLAQNPQALQLLQSNNGTLDSATKARIEEARASMEWVPRMGLTTMYLCTLWAYWGLANTGNPSVQWWNGWLLPALLTIPAVMFFLLRRKA
jgi:hypothetical protein